MKYPVGTWIKLVWPYDYTHIYGVVVDAPKKFRGNRWIKKEPAIYYCKVWNNSKKEFEENAYQSKHLDYYTPTVEEIQKWALHQMKN